VIWEPATGETRTVWTGHADWRRCVATAPDGTWLAINGPRHTVGIWDLATATRRVELTGHAHAVTETHIARDGAWVATASRDDETVRIWDTATGDDLAVLSSSTGWMGPMVAIAPDSTWLAATSRDHTARIWDAPQSWDGGAGDGTPALAMTVHSGGVWLTTRDPDGDMRILDAATGTVHAEWGHVGWSAPFAVADQGHRDRP
jgi:WD40 repeat protein